MIINTNNLSEALESILSNCINECNTSYSAWRKVQHGGTKDAYKQYFNTTYATLVEMQKFVVRDYLSTQQRMDWDKVKVFYADLNNLNKPFDVNDLVWFNSNTGKVEEEV
jgi:hypothetical protein